MNEIVDVIATQSIGKQAVHVDWIDLLRHGFFIVYADVQLSAVVLIGGACIAHVRAAVCQGDELLFRRHQLLIAQAIHVFEHQIHASGRTQAAHQRRHADKDFCIGAFAHFTIGPFF